jgi:hypothetical protein
MSSDHPRDIFVRAIDGLSGLAAREALTERAANMDKLRWIFAHRDAGDEALALVAALSRALLDRRISAIERNDIISKAEALIRALRSAPEVE